MKQRTFDSTSLVYSVEGQKELQRKFSQDTVCLWLLHYQHCCFETIFSYFETAE